jgi:hypothetical protein
MIPPKVIVLILNYNGKHLLDDSISSYLENDYQNFEVVVIDNGSTDGTEEYVKNSFPTVKLLRTEMNLGYSGGFNRGLKYAFGEGQASYVLISNNDLRADKRVISELFNVIHSDERAGFVTGKVYYFDRPDTLQTVGKSEDPIYWNGNHIGGGEVDRGQYDQVAERVFADDVFTMVRKQLYDDVGGYDTTFFLQSEEYDWQARAKKAGYKILYTPHAKVWHKESQTIGKRSPLKAFYDARNPMLVILLHRSPEFFRRYFWHHIANDVFLSSLRAAKRFQFTTALKMWEGFFSGLGWAVQHRKLTYNHFL